jgi:exonuclease III
MNKKGMEPYMRKLMGENRFDFICIQETILQDFSDKFLRKFDPNREYLWDWIPAKGKSGGVVSRIRDVRFDVGQRRQGDFVLKHNLWDKKLEVKWNLMNVYGAAQEEHKEAFLTELASFWSENKEPMLVGGDFNILRFSSEKNKTFHPNMFSRIFNTLIHMHELREIYICGGQGTWSNNHESPTLEKLDRVLMSEGWETRFPTVQVHKTPMECSDHNPLILASEVSSSKRQRIFIFELPWLRDEECLCKI